MRKNKYEEEHQITQDLDLERSPHLERDSIGGALDLYLLSPFPQKDARNSGGVKRMLKLFKVSNGGGRMVRRTSWVGGGREV